MREDGSGAGPEGLSQGGIETHLAYAESCLINGQLSTAAAHIQKLVQVSVGHLIFSFAWMSAINKSGKLSVDQLLESAVCKRTWRKCTACMDHCVIPCLEVAATIHS